MVNVTDSGLYLNNLLVNNSSLFEQVTPVLGKPNRDRTNKKYNSATYYFDSYGLLIRTVNNQISNITLSKTSAKSPAVKSKNNYKKKYHPKNKFTGTFAINGKAEDLTQLTTEKLKTLNGYEYNLKSNSLFIDMSSLSFSWEDNFLSISLAKEPSFDVKSKFDLLKYQNKYPQGQYLKMANQKLDSIYYYDIVLKTKKDKSVSSQCDEYKANKISGKNKDVILGFCDSLALLNVKNSKDLINYWSTVQTEKYKSKSKELYRKMVNDEYKRDRIDLAFYFYKTCTEKEKTEENYNFTKKTLNDFFTDLRKKEDGYSILAEYAIGVDKSPSVKYNYSYESGDAATSSEYVKVNFDVKNYTSFKDTNKLIVDFYYDDKKQVLLKELKKSERSYSGSKDEYHVILELDKNITYNFISARNGKTELFKIDPPPSADSSLNYEFEIVSLEKRDKLLIFTGMFGMSLSGLNEQYDTVYSDAKNKVYLMNFRLKSTKEKFGFNSKSMSFRFNNTTAHPLMFGIDKGETMIVQMGDNYVSSSDEFITAFQIPAATDINKYSFYIFNKNLGLLKAISKEETQTSNVIKGVTTTNIKQPSSLDKKIIAAMKASIVSYFKNATPKGNAGFSITKFENFNFNKLLHSMAIIGGGSIQIDGGGNSFAGEGSEVQAKFSDPKHTSTDKLIVEGLADGNRGFSSITKITFIEDVVIEANDGKKYLFMNGHWTSINK